MRCFFIIFCLLILFTEGYSQNDAGDNNLSDTILFPSNFFDIDEPLELTLRFDIKNLTKEKSDKDYLPAELFYFINDTLKIEKNIRIRARGKFRKKQCYFPPYWINVKKSNVNEDYISSVNKIKVVSHCKDSKTYNDYLLKEYIAYKLLNIITDYSFKVRLAKIKYIDTGRENKITKNWAFMIEPEDLLAKRLEAYPLKMDKISYRQCDPLKTTIMSIFQYMIGNTDYSVAGRHNVKLLTLKDYTKPELIVIPYDFDFSGIVNTIYAKPSEKIGIKSVTERYFYGMCRSDETYNEVLNLFREKENDIFSFIDSFEFIDKRMQKYVRSYIEEFYDEIEQTNFVKKNIRPSCEKLLLKNS